MSPKKETFVAKDKKGNQYEITFFATLATNNDTLESLFEIVETQVKHRGESKGLIPEGTYYSKRFRHPKQGENEPYPDRRLLTQQAVLPQEMALYQFFSETLGPVALKVLLFNASLELIKPGLEGHAQTEPMLLLGKGKIDLLKEYEIVEEKERTGYDVSPRQLVERLRDFIGICWRMHLIHGIDYPVTDFKLEDIVRTADISETNLDERQLAFIDFSLNQGRLLEVANSKLGISVSSGYFPHLNPDRFNNIFRNISLDIYALMVSFHRMVQGFVASYDVTKGDGSDEHLQKIFSDLRKNRGLEVFFQQVSNYQNNSGIEHLTTFFSNYFDLNTFNQIDRSVEEDQYPQELNVERIARYVANLFGFEVDDSDLENGWKLTVTDEQKQSLQRAQTVFEEKMAKRDGLPRAVRVNPENVKSKNKKWSLSNLKNRLLGK